MHTNGMVKGTGCHKSKLGEGDSLTGVAVSSPIVHN